MSTKNRCEFGIHETFEEEECPKCKAKEERVTKTLSLGFSVGLGWAIGYLVAELVRKFYGE